MGDGVSLTGGTDARASRAAAQLRGMMWSSIRYPSPSATSQETKNEQSKGNRESDQSDLLPMGVSANACA